MTSKNLFNYLCCPKCKKKITKKQNSYVCGYCSVIYKIKNEIPVLIDYKSLTPHLRQQIRYFEKEKASQSKDYQLELWQESYVDRFLAHAKDKSLIYDCGSGSGYMAIELAKRGYSVIVSDITFRSVARIKRVAEKLGIDKNMLFVCSLAEELPIANNSVSEFIAHAVLEHLSNEKKAIEEWKSVTKNNGLLFITVPLKFRNIFPLLWIPNYIHDKRIGHLRRYDKRILREKFKIPVLKTYYTGHLIKIVGILAVMLNLAKSDDRKFEIADSKMSKSAFWANNISVVLLKNKKT